MLSKENAFEIDKSTNLEFNDFNQRVNNYIKSLKEEDGKLVDYEPQRIRSEFMKSISAMYTSYRYYSNDETATMEVIPHITDSETNFTEGYIVNLHTDLNQMQLVMSDKGINEISMVIYKVLKNGHKKLVNYLCKSDSYHKYGVVQLDILEQLKKLISEIAYLYSIAFFRDDKIYRTKEELDKMREDRIASEEYYNSLSPEEWEEIERSNMDPEDEDEDVDIDEEIRDAAEKIRKEKEQRDKEKKRHQDNDDDSNNDK